MYLMKRELQLGLAELLGTYFLVFFGTGAMVVNDFSEGVITHLGVAFAFGVSVMGMIFTFGDISGAHMNPAVSIAFWSFGKLSVQRMVSFIIFQLIGALMASYTLLGLFPESSSFGETIPQGPWEQSLIMEFILSFVLMLVIIFVATGGKEKGMTAAIAIGFTVFMCALVGGPISVASMNPARTFGPALVSGNYSYFWIYLIAPISAMLLVVLVWKFIKQNNE